MAETCVNRMKESGGKNRCKNMMICAFCRTPKEESDEDELQRVNKMIGNGNAYAYMLADTMSVDFMVCHKIRQRLMSYY